MAKDLFYSLDLNLLRTFLVLSQELNMRKASERLFVSQPAISQSLRKLRNHFNDELFVKVPYGLEATPFAEALAINITPHLDALSSALSQAREFDPANIQQKIKIALSPIVMASLSGSLVHQIREQAPNAQLELVSWSASTIDDIRKGEVLLGINYDLDPPKDVYIKHVIQLSGQVIVRQDHPIKKALASPEDFEDYEIASFITPGWNENFSLAAEIMKQRGLRHKIGFRSELLMAIFDVITHTDMYMPHSNLFPIEQYPYLRAIDIELDGHPYHYDVYAYYHTKHRKQPLLLWLDQLIVDALRQQITN
ncbi:LysR family transcriptional regulator [Vibrio sp. NTOU-M3]|uniref:LysR family transcriptional regulator n=1 Tax=Vibrio sp. NTOU-M3 TaxID=3234954 RepID=UPI00349F493B